MFISYAQNHEDVMLWHAFKHIENGFYIDVGANDPEEDSVTKAFYDRGWHGINIEPVPEYYKRLCDNRLRDINLAIAAGASDGEMTLFDIPAVRGWGSSDATVAENHRKEGFEVEELTVSVRMLASICEEHVKGEIHFLKIDVEGFEAEVIRGMDFKKWRPWILLIEATKPNSQVTNYEGWEPMLIEHKYHFAYFDGLNRYYVAEEHKNLMEELKTQPNVFDQFVSIGHMKALEAAQAAELRAQTAEKKLAEISATTAEKKLAEVRAQKAEATLMAMRNSTSWQLTRPLRALARLIK